MKFNINKCRKTVVETAEKANCAKASVKTAVNAFNSVEHQNKNKTFCKYYYLLIKMAYLMNPVY